VALIDPTGASIKRNCGGSLVSWHEALSTLLPVLSRGAACVGLPLEREMRIATLPTATSRCAGSSWLSISAQSISVASDGCGEGGATRTQPNRGTTPRGGRTCVRLTKTKAFDSLLPLAHSAATGWQTNATVLAHEIFFFVIVACWWLGPCHTTPGTSYLRHVTCTV
jgi:hypothetical protein